MENKIKRTIIPTSCDVIKTGKSSKDGKSWKWTLFRVQATVVESNKSQSFSSFDDFTAKIGQEVVVEVETSVKEKDGKQYTNYTISLPKRNIWDVIASIEARLDELEGMVSGKLMEKPATISSDEEKAAEEIPTEILPF